MNAQQLKEAVRTYWNKGSCGTECTQQEKFSRSYFDEIEQHRYSVEPEIFSFAQFTRAYGKKVLEVGVGAGTDFLQWVRAGAQAYGIDLTQESVDHVLRRLHLYNLQACDVQVCDAESISYSNNSFDLVYSWGVIHHSPDPIKCLDEIIRVAKSGGTIKLMMYNRHSLFAFYRYVLAGLLKGKPFTSFKAILYHHQESLGTKAYTIKEIRKIIGTKAVAIKKIHAPATQHDLLYYKSRFFRIVAYFLACCVGWNRVGWFIMIELEKNVE